MRACDREQLFSIVRHGVKPMTDVARYELEVHRRYERVRSFGWKGIVWLECGVYYLANDSMKPDFNDKHRMTLAEFDALLISVEGSYAEKKSPTSEDRAVNAVQQVS